jgi:CRP-like cAMP-binding protein
VDKNADDNLAALEQAAKAFHRAEQKLDEQRGVLHHAIVEAVDKGVTKSEAARRTGYTREYVTRICDR